MTKLYLIRHAEAEGNLYRIAHGQYNSILTDRGWQQVAALRDRFAGIPIDAVYSSDLCRTCSTAEAIYVPKNLPLQKRKDLREYCLGVWEQMSWGEIERSDLEQLSNFGLRLDLWHVDGAETPQQVLERVLRAIREIAEENPEKTVAVFSHGAALRTLLGYLEGYSLRELGKTPHGDNTAVSLLEVDGDSIRVVFRDDNSHLENTLSTLAGQTWMKRQNGVEPGLAFDRLDPIRQEQAAKEYSFTPHEARVALIASLEGKEVGLLQLDTDCGADRGEGWISACMMLPQWQRKGYGIQLLGQAVKYYRPLGRKKLCVSLDAENGQARRFAVRYGFRETAGTDANSLIYEKNIEYPASYTGEL